MFKTCLLVLLALSASSQAKLSLPPTTGNFTYMKVNKDRGNRLSGNFTISDQNFTLGFSSVHSHLIMASQDCSHCLVTSKFNQTEALRTNSTSLSSSRLHYAKWYNLNFEAQSASDININKGNFYEGQIGLDFVSNNTSINQTFFVIDSTDLKYHSELDGAIGIQSDMNDPNSTFVNKLVQNGLIDSPVMSFYTSTTGNQSYVKFGSMDESAFEGNVSQVGTTNTNSWSLQVVNASIGNDSLPIDSFMTVNLDPMLPYIYVPSAHWTIFKDSLKTNFGSDVECDTFVGSCKFLNECS